MRLLLLGFALAAGIACGRTGNPPGSLDAAIDVTSGRDVSDEPVANLCSDHLAGLGGGPAGLVDCESGDGLRLCGAPMLFRPTAHGFAINAVVASGDPLQLTAKVRPTGDPVWQSPLAAAAPTSDLAQWNVDGLMPGVRYQYELRGPSETGEGSLLYSGSVVTQRNAGEPFVFALMSDSHIGPDWAFTNQGDWCMLATVAKAVDAASPDFVLNLGDMLDFHQFGFNEPSPNDVYTRRAYRNYRALLGDLLGHAAHFPVIGNWEGEDGWFSSAALDLSRGQRLLYMPAPLPTTYPQSGSPAEDYYAFTWGDALFVVLNVMSYTPTPHLLSTGEGAPDDWTLGSAQLEWLSTTLAAATAKWRFLFIHHPVGGAAGDAENSAYGRGGGQAAHIGEQAKVHQLMLDHGVQIFFYGHDHVFTDMVVDGIHYAEPGSAGATWMFSSVLTGYKQSWLESGWARVAVGPEAVQVRFLSNTGQVIYQYELQ
jgi:hypothetical protein